MDSGHSKLLIYCKIPTLSLEWKMLLMANVDIHALKWGYLWGLRKLPKGRSTWKNSDFILCTLENRTMSWLASRADRRPVLPSLLTQSRIPSECHTCRGLHSTSVKQANQFLTWMQRGREEASQSTPESSSGCRHSSHLLSPPSCRWDFSTQQMSLLMRLSPLCHIPYGGTNKISKKRLPVNFSVFC